MNDSNNNPDYSEISVKANYKKLNINSRSLGIYEQYLKTTLHSNNKDLSKRSNEAKTSDVEVPSTEKTASLSNPHLMIASTNKNVITTDITADNPKSSSKILMIIGGFCLLLLVALVTILFTATDTLVERLSSVDSQMSQVSDNLTVISKDNALATAQATADEKAANAVNVANAQSLAALKDSLNIMVLNAEIAKAVAEPVMITKERSMPLGGASIEPEQNSLDYNDKSGLSYNAFKEESQDVLYRDSSY